MPPTVYMISEHEKSNMKSCEDNGEQGLKFSLKYKTNGKELKSKYLNYSLNTFHSVNLF